MKKLIVFGFVLCLLLSGCKSNHIIDDIEGYDPTPTVTVAPAVTVTPTVTVAPAVTVTPTVTVAPGALDTPTGDSLGKGEHETERVF